MNCPFCQATDTKVLDSRNLQEEYTVRRRRKCEICEKRFTTYENIEIDMPMVIKNDGRREEYSKEKILLGIQRACQKRPVSSSQIDRIITNIEKSVMDIGDKEVRTRDIGHLVMMYLKHLDPVAYVRFASVYINFHDVDEFVKGLKEEKSTFQNVFLNRPDENSAKL
ncbi:MAG: transcriptional repressor NrdR [Bacteriovoracaceae bacterium]|nr:transcriptional repressor NrdR [Bacteriovoracaceae bacterium]